ncbi:MAG: 30S ribosomal protein S15 [Candidatus Pacearchaeota archaeon]
MEKENEKIEKEKPVKKIQKKQVLVEKNKVEVKTGKSLKAGTLSKEEVEKLILELYKQGNKPEIIGMILRDTYSVPNVKEICGKKIVKIIREKMPYFPSDLEALQEKIKKLRAHLEKNRHDYKSKRSLQILEARIRILNDYYRKKGILK